MTAYQGFQQWVGPDDPCYRTTVPLAGANYQLRLQCFLMDFLQTPLDHDPASPLPGLFLSSTVPETLLFHKRFNKGSDNIYRYGIQFLQPLSDVEVSIYIFKDKDLHVRGRMHYRVEALAVCFDQDGRIITEPSGDSCMGFVAIQWYNDKKQSTEDWDTMDFTELLRLLRRTAKRNFDDNGNLRSEEDQITMDKALGMVFPNRGGGHPEENPPHLGKEMLHAFAPADVQPTANVQPQVQSQSQRQELDMTPIIQSQSQQQVLDVQPPLQVQPQLQLQPDLRAYALHASAIHAQQQGDNLQQFNFWDFPQEGDEFDDLI